MAIESPRYFQCPNSLVDEMLTDMTMAELKIFLLINRNTLGWLKKKDKISFSQIAEKTGLSKSNISKAIKSLLKKDYICRELSGNGRSKIQIFELKITENNWILKNNGIKTESITKNNGTKTEPITDNIGTETEPITKNIGTEKVPTIDNINYKDNNIKNKNISDAANADHDRSVIQTKPRSEKQKKFDFLYDNVIKVYCKEYEKYFGLPYHVSGIDYKAADMIYKKWTNTPENMRKCFDDDLEMSSVLSCDFFEDEKLEGKYTLMMLNVKFDSLMQKVKARVERVYGRI
jgi:phage replication O-like protein O